MSKQTLKKAERFNELCVMYETAKRQYHETKELLFSMLDETIESKELSEAVEKFYEEQER